MVGRAGLEPATNGLKAESQADPASPNAIEDKKCAARKRVDVMPGNAHRGI